MPDEKSEEQNLSNPINKVMFVQLQTFPLEKMGITLQDIDHSVRFKKGNVTIEIVYADLLIIGAKKIFEMFSLLDR
jgi:hypothetical protein